MDPECANECQQHASLLFLNDGPLLCQRMSKTQVTEFVSFCLFFFQWWALNVPTKVKNTCHGIRHFCLFFLIDGPWTCMYLLVCWDWRVTCICWFAGIDVSHVFVGLLGLTGCMYLLVCWDWRIACICWFAGTNGLDVFVSLLGWTGCIHLLVYWDWRVTYILLVCLDWRATCNC